MDFLLRTGPPKRYTCANRKTFAAVWPSLLSRRVPAARPLCRWAARHGAAVHCALQLQRHEKRGCAIVATRSIAAGQALVSTPLALSITAARQDDDRGSFAHRFDPLEQLTGIFARELHNPGSFHRLYAEFLHDAYNDGDEFDVKSKSLADQLDAIYMGNSASAKGVSNAPFLPKSNLRSSLQRVEWVRLRHLLRRIEQSLPHFASKSASWAMSMVLSRAIPDDHESLTLYPIIDFCLHSFQPNVLLCVTHPRCSEDEGVGVKWYDATQPCAHLVAQRTIAPGETLKILYSQRRVDSLEDEEYWRLRWGFVPRA